VTNALAFELPRSNEAAEPPEARGLERDEVRLLVAEDEHLHHARFLDLPDFLGPGDLLVVNASATLPAALDAARESGERVALHLSTPLPGNGPAPIKAGDVTPHWVVELRRDNARVRDARAGEILELPACGHARLIAPYLSAGRLWVAALAPPAPLSAYLAEHGRPIAYRHTHGAWPLRDYQSIFATEPGSAEMPSAGRPFSPRLMQALRARGVEVARVVLHTGVSSLERGELPYPERYRIPPETAAAVNAAKRTIAVGTTVVRALETVAAPDGTVAAAEGWTRLTITPERGVRAVDGLITGWHEPDASHLLMLEAIAGRETIERSYRAALEHGYLWHEFGDSHLLLRDR
jgi:S-adenosylmethionine:tRNA ribosyltransferase-isomerase